MAAFSFPSPGTCTVDAMYSRKESTQPSEQSPADLNYPLLSVAKLYIEMPKQPSAGTVIGGVHRLVNRGVVETPQPIPGRFVGATARAHAPTG